jgi:hypothetical protein
MHALTKEWERQRSRKQSRGRVGFGANRALPVAARCRQDGRSLSFPRHTSAPYGCSQGAAETTVIGLGAAFNKGREFTNSADTLLRYDMQCVDCHNRPTHTFELPEHAMDEALARGEIAVTLPYVKKRGMEALKATTVPARKQLTNCQARSLVFIKRATPTFTLRAPKTARPVR